MKSIFLLLICALMLCFLPASTVAQDSNVRIDSQDIKLEEVELPAETALADPAVKEFDEDWWHISIKFSTEEELTEEVQIKVYLAAYDYFKEIEDQNGYVVLTSEVTFINVPQGDDHVATFYLHPGSAIRYGGDKGIASFGRTSGEHNVHVEVFDRGRLVVEMDMTEDDPNWFREGPPIPDVLMSVEESPWWPFVSRAYNQIQKKR